MLDSDDNEPQSQPQPTVKGRTLAKEEERAILLSQSGRDLIDTVPVNCFGERNDSEDDPPFHYFLYQQFRTSMMICEKLEKFQQSKKGRSADQLMHYTDEKLTEKMLMEFGVMDTNSEIFTKYFATYRKVFVEKLKGWATKSLDVTEEDVTKRQNAVKERIEELLRCCPWFENLGSLIFSQKVDWFQLPRPTLFCLDLNSPYYLKEAGAQIIYVTEMSNPSGDGSVVDSTVAVLLPSKAHPLNLVLMEPAVSFPAEILFTRDICTEEVAINLKAMITVFPKGICVDWFLENYKVNYGGEPNYEPFGNFVNFCKRLPDIFLISEAGRILLFPADFVGTLKPISAVMEKLWHFIKFTCNYHNGRISTAQVLPKLYTFFNITISPFHWGFQTEEDFLKFLISKVCPQRNFILCQDITNGNLDLCFVPQEEAGADVLEMNTKALRPF